MRRLVTDRGAAGLHDPSGVRPSEAEAAELVAAANGKPLFYLAVANPQLPAVPAVSGIVDSGRLNERAATVLRAIGDPTADLVEFPVATDSPETASRDALRAAAALGEQLGVIRLHATEPLSRCSVWDELGDFPPPGINPPMVYKLRAKLDQAGHERVHIAVSGTFDADRIRRFERVHTPVDAYCIAPSIFGTSAAGDSE